MLPRQQQQLDSVPLVALVVLQQMPRHLVLGQIQVLLSHLYFQALDKIRPQTQQIQVPNCLNINLDFGTLTVAGA